MDYTLAQYIPETFEALVYAQALGVLVSRLGYPEEVRCFQFDAGYMVRGLAVDKARGNVLKASGCGVPGAGGPRRALPPRDRLTRPHPRSPPRWTVTST